MQSVYSHGASHRTHDGTSGPGRLGGGRGDRGSLHPFRVRTVAPAPSPPITVGQSHLTSSLLTFALFCSWRQIQVTLQGNMCKTNTRDSRISAAGVTQGNLCSQPGASPVLGAPRTCARPCEGSKSAKLRGQRGHTLQALLCRKQEPRRTHRTETGGSRQLQGHVAGKHAE